MWALLIGLQAVQVAILWLHDWLPMGRLNDIPAVQAADSRGRLIKVTLIQSVPWTIGLVGSLRHLGGPWPDWLWMWLWGSYTVLFLGELRAWWFPYLVRAEPERAARYAGMFGATHAFLTMHNGMRPNTLHVVLHLCTGLTLVILAVVRG